MRSDIVLYGECDPTIGSGFGDRAFNPQTLPLLGTNCATGFLVQTQGRVFPILT
jgi:hypothetical protein